MSKSIPPKGQEGLTPEGSTTQEALDPGKEIIHSNMRAIRLCATRLTQLQEDLLGVGRLALPTKGTPAMY